MRKITMLLIALMVISVGFLSGCNEQTANKKENDEELNEEESFENENNDAYLYFQECVLDVLIAPATAQFPSISEATIVKKDENTWGVVSYVDAQNTYGALIRKYYGCELVENQGLWSLSSMYDGDGISDVDHALYKWNFIAGFIDDDEGVDIDMDIGKKELTTTSFKINGERWRFDWMKYGKMDADYILDPTLFITPYYSSSSSSISSGWVFVSSEYGYFESETRYIYEGNDFFYLDISSFNVIDWTVAVYEGVKCE